MNGIRSKSFGTIFDGELLSLTLDGEEVAWDDPINVAIAIVDPLCGGESRFHDSFKSGIGYIGRCVPGASVVSPGEVIVLS